MTEEDAKAWVKNKTNQDQVVKKFFKDYPPSKLKMAFFMAGIPGSGKTEFAQNTINESSPKLIPIEHDRLVEYIEGYIPEDYYKFRKAGSVLVSRILKECLLNSYGFIFDGTLSHEHGINNIKLCLKHDYRVMVVYIVQDISLAWELTQARELVKKRAIERTGFIETCKKINFNLLNIFKTYKTTPNFSFWIINKQGQADMSNASAIIHDERFDKSEEIEKTLSTGYNIGI